jgi:hypothetical protein
MKLYTIEEIRELIRNDEVERNDFKSFIIEEYPIVFNIQDDINKMIDWYFVTYDSIYHQEMYVKCDKNISDLKVNEDYYIKLKVYENSDSNLDYYSLFIGSIYRKDYKNIDEIYEDIKYSFKDSLFYIPKDAYDIRNYGKDIDLYFKTKDEWHGNYNIDGQDMCLGTLCKPSSNLGITSIRLSGNDDYSISQDFWSYGEAREHWDYLSQKKFVNQYDLINSYFSN